MSGNRRVVETQEAQLIFIQLQLGEEQGVKGTYLGKYVKSNYRKFPTISEVDFPTMKGEKQAVKTRDPDRKEELIQ